MSICALLEYYVIENLLALENLIHNILIHTYIVDQIMF